MSAKVPLIPPQVGYQSIEDYVISMGKRTARFYCSAMRTNRSLKRPKHCVNNILKGLQNTLLKNWYQIKLELLLSVIV